MNIRWADRPTPDPTAVPAPLPRRSFLAASAAACSLPLLPRSSRTADVPAGLPPVRKLTTGPKYHWFGYYDKWQFDPSGERVLSNEVDFEGRSPTADDVIRVGTVDTAGERGFEAIGETRAWGWQQGCMLQWVPGTGNTVIWNDREGERFVSRILDLGTGEQRVVPQPVYNLAPDGKTAINADFRRINDLRPGYGYAGLPDPYAHELTPSESGIRRVNLETGESELVISIAQVSQIGPIRKDMRGAKHYFNHLLFNPDGTRFIFLHRWRPDGGRGGFKTRMFTAAADGSDLYLLDRSGNTSHFIWRDPNHICAWTAPVGRKAGFWLFTDRSDEVVQVGKGVMTENGHNTYLAAGDGREWILNDTYPKNAAREQNVYLYHVPTGRKVDLGYFHSPPRYTGEWRTDTHPRSGRDGRLVCVDSTHGGDGRQLYLIDVSAIVGAA